MSNFVSSVEQAETKVLSKELCIDSTIKTVKILELMIAKVFGPQF